MTERDKEPPIPDPHERLQPERSKSVVATAAPDLSAIVVSWNSERFLDECLGSLFAQRGVTLEVVVVDNGSTDGSEALVRNRHPRARWIPLGSNLGFCAANNVGIAATEAPFLLFANADLILDPDFAREALRPFEHDERLGFSGGKLLRFDRTTIDSAGQFMTRSRRVVERGYGCPDGPQISGEGYVFSICGAALLCRRAMIEDVSIEGQFFDESYFAFSEDLDVGWRARLGGWRAWYTARAIGYHYRGGTEPGGRRRGLPALLRRPRALRFHILKNRWLTMIKNDSAPSVARDLPFIVARDLALLAACAVSTPGVLIDLARALPLSRVALRHRRQFLARRGRWGSRRPGARSAWVRWSAPTAQDPSEA